MDLAIVCSRHPPPPPPRGEVTPYNGLYGKALPGRVTFFSLQVYGMLGISLAEVYECVGTYVISSVKRLKRANRCILRQWKKLRKRSGFVIYSWYVKESVFTVVEKGCKVLYLVCERGRTSGWRLSVYHFCSTPETLWTGDEAHRTRICVGGLTYFRSSPCFTVK